MVLGDRWAVVGGQLSVVSVAQVLGLHQAQNCFEDFCVGRCTNFAAGSGRH